MYSEPVLLSPSSLQPVSHLLRLISLYSVLPVDSDSDSEGISSGNFSGCWIHCSSKMHAINYFLSNMIQNIMYESQRPYISQTHPMDTKMNNQSKVGQNLPQLFLLLRQT